jgi:hypothetical protein
MSLTQPSEIKHFFSLIASESIRRAGSARTIVCPHVVSPTHRRADFGSPRWPEFQAGSTRESKTFTAHQSKVTGKRSSVLCLRIRRSHRRAGSEAHNDGARSAHETGTTKFIDGRLAPRPHTSGLVERCTQLRIFGLRVLRVCTATGRNAHRLVAWSYIHPRL